LNQLEKSTLIGQPEEEDKQENSFSEYDSQINESLDSFLDQMKKKEEDQMERYIQAHEILCQMTDKVDEEFIKSLPKDLQYEIYKQLKYHRLEDSPQSNLSSPSDISMNQLSNFIKRSQMKKKISNIVFEREEGLISKGNLASNTGKSYYLIDRSQNDSLNSTQEIIESLTPQNDFIVDFEPKNTNNSMEEISDEEFEEIESNKIEVPLESEDEFKEIEAGDEDEFVEINGEHKPEDEIELEINIETSDMDQNEFIKMLKEYEGNSSTENLESVELIEDDDVEEIFPNQISSEKKDKLASKPEIEEIISQKEKSTKEAIREEIETIEEEVIIGEEYGEEDEDDESRLSPTSIYEKQTFQTPTKNDMRRKFLENEANVLQEEITKIEKQSSRVTKALLEDTRELLTILGLPIVNSPYEADSQCSFLNIVGAVDGVITEDSDVFLFGSTNVYRHLFGKDSNPQLYSMPNIKKVLGLDRSKLIQMGMLLGSDYTIGVHNVGIVTSMELACQFSNDHEDIKVNILESLNQFSIWTKDFKSPQKETFDAKYVNLSFIQ
jgi:DNA excision repair protein ERCC-5